MVNSHEKTQGKNFSVGESSIQKALRQELFNLLVCPKCLSHRVFKNQQIKDEMGVLCICNLVCF